MPPRLNLVGRRFGKLIVFKDNGNNKLGKAKWLCVCDCGNKTIISGNSLVSGNTRSCGCYQKERVHEAIFKNLIGYKIGKLTVINFYKIKNKKNYWRCQCSCGKEAIVVSYNLISGHTQSCGCYHQESITGENSHFWQGGVSFEPYCPLWTKELRRRIRSFFKNECVICGKTTKENKKQLCCHHVTYNKMSCCDGKPVHFAALCVSCHARTNNNRERWELILHRIIDEIYDGKSYYTKKRI
jgi:hypothetical protein